MKPVYALLFVTVVTIGCGGEASTTATKASVAAPSAALQQESSPATAPAADLKEGKQIYDTACAACHGTSGKGDGPGAGALDPKPRDFSDKAYMTKLTDADIRNTIKYGGGIKGMPQMPSHPQFSEAELASLVAHVRSMQQ